MSNTISISPGNSKMGVIPSVSLPPIKTCPAGCPCAKKCYAAKLCRIRKNVREAYERNLAAWNEDPAAYEMQVKAAACTTRFFRWHVAGDIPSMEYLQMVFRIARDLPGTEFLMFTKRYNLVNDLMYNEDLPRNLHVIFSEWGEGFKPYNPHNLPTAAVIFKGEEPKDNWKVCGGNCTECACRGCGCWELKKGETIAFYEH